MENQKTLEPYERSGITCPHCNKELPKSLFVKYLKSNFIRYFLFTFALAFTLIAVISDIRMHYSDDPSKISSINPYRFALPIAGIFSLLGWLGQKRKDMNRVISEHQGKKENE